MKSLHAAFLSLFFLPSFACAVPTGAPGSDGDESIEATHAQALGLSVAPGHAPTGSVDDGIVVVHPIASLGDGTDIDSGASQASSGSEGTCTCGTIGTGGVTNGVTTGSGLNGTGGVTNGVTTGSGLNGTGGVTNGVTTGSGLNGTGGVTNGVTTCTCPATSSVVPPVVVPIRVIAD
jgi:hypothetical protein